jgi:tRNA 2-thiocytidine biosynthesis protein TtcA
MPSRVELRLLRRVTRANNEHQLIGPGDRVMACMSGGKDSYGMLHLLMLLQKRLPYRFQIVAVNLDQGHPGFPGHILEGWLEERGVPHRMLHQDTYSVVTEKIPVGKTYCSLCSRLRRGILYQAAEDLGCTRIAYGHHRDDVIETLLLNLLYAGQIKSMPARLRSDDGRNTLIRPLVYCTEADLSLLAQEQQFPILPCDLCGSQETLKRKRVKRLIAELAAENDKVPGNLFAALGNVVPSHLYDQALRSAVGLDPVSGERVGVVENVLPADVLGDAEPLADRP